MLYEKDTIMRMIQTLSRSLGQIIFGKDMETEPLLEEDHIAQDDPLRQPLLGLIADGAYNKAENLLFEQLEPGNIRHLAIALDFYARLNELSDAQLEKGGFSREEAYEGLNDIAHRFGVNL